MKIKLIVGTIVVLMLFTLLNSATASMLDCGQNISVAMVKVDANGFAPRLSKGDQAQFDCVTAYDPNFYLQRFPDTRAAMNYYYSLLGQAWGVVFEPLAAPSP